MKNKKDDSIFNKKGFYAALYSCIGVVLILTVVISYQNFKSVLTPKNSGQIQQSQSTEEPVAEVGNNMAKKIPQDSGVKVDLDDQVGLFPTATAATQARSSYAQASLPAPVPTAAPATAKPQQSSAESNDVTAQTETVANPKAPTVEAQEQPEQKQASEAEQSNATVEVFNYYTGDSKMSWPVLGQVVMDFNMTGLIYDRTLDQYRTNDNICIAAEPGTPVKAASDGIVTSVYTSREDGNVVVIDNGNGWITTYSQLQDGVLVNPGDMVKQGKIIGGVSSPTIYKVLTGSHVGVKVTKDNVPVDPKTVME